MVLLRLVCLFDSLGLFVCVFVCVWLVVCCALFGRMCVRVFVLLFVCVLMCCSFVLFVLFLCVLLCLSWLCAFVVCVSYVVFVGRVLVGLFLLFAVCLFVWSFCV